MQKAATLRFAERWHALLVAALALSAFTHLWNPAGFPDIFYDEGVYMRRAMHVLEGLGPQERTFYDHPYFGQLFLASVFWLAGYPDSLDPSATAQSVESLYAVPRVLMGVLAVADTFLTYKIAELRYGRKVAIIASLLFAVMPVTWFTRRILLDSIMLPFLLSSMLLAIYAGRYSGSKRAALVLASGALLGIAIFTKAPAFLMTPAVAYLAYKSGSSAKNIAILLAPAMAIPLLWPAYSMALGQFDQWLEGVSWQAQRSAGGLFYISWVFLLYDPVMFVLGAAGLVYAGIKRERFTLLWVVPYFVFLAATYAQYFHWIPVLPVLCIAAARLFERVTESRKVLAQATATLAVFGLVSTTLLVTTNVTSAQFEAAAFAANLADDRRTIVASPSYSWLYMYVFDKNSLSDYRDLLFYEVRTDGIILIADRHFLYNIGGGDQLKDAYDGTENAAVFYGREPGHRFYPFTNLYANFEGSVIEVRAN